MKWFYIISLAVAAAMIASPYLLLPSDAGGHTPPVTVGYRDDGSPIVKSAPVVRFASYRSAIRSIDPATCGDTSSAHLQAHFYEGLYAYHYLKRPLEIIPLLAAELPAVSRDRRTYTITLKPDVRYARNECFGLGPDGRPNTRTVRADDFVLAFKRIADHHVGADLAWALLRGRVAGLEAYYEQTRTYEPGDFSRYDLDIDGVRALDDHTLQIRLVEPFPQLLQVLAMHIVAPIPREMVDHWLARDGEAAAEITDPRWVVATGPYRLETFQRKHRIVLVRNPDFRRQTYPAQGAPGDAEAGLLDDAGEVVPFVDVIRMDYVAEEYARWIRLLNRDVDAAAIPSDLFESVVTPDRQLADRWRRRHIALEIYEPPSTYWLVFNANGPVLSASPSLRKAICLSIDVEGFIDVLRNGRGRRAVNCIPASLRDLTPSSYEAHQLAGQGPSYRYDPSAAREMLAQARDELAAAGLLVGGRIPPLRLDLGGRGNSEMKMGDFYKQQFQRVGLTLQVTLNDWPTLQEKAHAGRCQIFAMGWHADYPDAENFLQNFYSGNIGGTNNSGYRNAEFDRLYERARVMADSPKRTKLYARMARIISEDCPVMMTTEPEAFVVHYEWVKNFKPHPVGYGFAKYIRIDVDQRRRLGGRED